MSALLHGAVSEDVEDENLENDMNQLSVEGVPTDVEFGNFEERLGKLKVK